MSGITWRKLLLTKIVLRGGETTMIPSKNQSNNDVRPSRVSEDYGHPGMLGMTPERLIESALQLQKAGENGKAETLYRKVLETDPNNIHALHLLGVIAMEMGNPESAASLIGKSLSIYPPNFKARFNLANALVSNGQTFEAIEELMQTLKEAPDYARAISLLTELMRKQERIEELAEILDEAQTAAPDCFEAKKEYGFTLAQLSRLDDAEKTLKECVEINPRLAQVHYNLGCVQKKLKKFLDAQISFQVALNLEPDHAAAKKNLAVAMASVGCYEQAIPTFLEAAENLPDDPEVWNNLCMAFRQLGRFDEAFEASDQAIKAEPGNHDIYNERGAAFQSFGGMKEAIENYQKALEIEPGAIGAEKNLLFALLNVPNMSSDDLFQMHLDIRKHHEKPEFSNNMFDHRDRDPDRKLRIGYLSSDFRTHVVSMNMTPLLTNKDADSYELYMYAQVDKPDVVTEQFQKIADHWRFITDIHDHDVAAMIEEDEIDILVFLAGRFDQNRPTICTYRPAPIQVSFHDCATSGFSEMDYWLTAEKFTEELFRLPIYYQYPVLERPTETIELPADENGYITFGCFNKPEKINEGVVELWAQILSAVPDSKLFLKYFRLFSEETIQQQWRERFARHGIPGDRLIFAANRVMRSDHLNVMSQADIALDPFPFNGATTTFDSISSGIPVICLKGRHFVDRVAYSILSHIGHSELAADSKEEYIRIACELAANRDRLRDLRKVIREDMINSPLCDGKAYARSLEDAFRDMWRHYCQEN